MNTATDDKPKPKADTSKAREAALATFRRRRAAKAIAELEGQGYTVIPPKDDA